MWLSTLGRERDAGGSGFSMYCTNMWAANMSCFNSGVVLVNGGGDAPRRKAHKVGKREFNVSLVYHCL